MTDLGVSGSPGIAMGTSKASKKQRVLGQGIRTVGVMGSLVCVEVTWPSSCNHSDCVLWLPTGPKDTEGCVSCGLESEAALQYHCSVGADQCPGGTKYIFPFNILP